MKADLHVHTTWSKDGVSTPQQVIDTCVERGIDIVAISDHNEFGAYDEVKNNGRVIVIPAEEVSSSEGHIIGLGIDRRIPEGLSVQETIDAIHAAGGYAVAVHPYRWWSGLGEKNVLAYDFDCTEALNARSVPHANIKSRRLAQKIGKPVTAGSDAHSPGRIGWGYVELPDGISDWQEAVMAIMDGKAVPYSASRHFVQTLRYGIKSIGQWMLRGFKRM